MPTQPPPANSTISMPGPHMPRLPVLDGWRAVSILAVLQCHLGPYDSIRSAHINEAAGLFGMALFFCLSGFLITSTLYVNPNVRVFLVRRVFRIVPVAWLFLLVTLPFASPRPSAATWMASLFFYINHWPFHMIDINAHMWSLGVEVQFYIGLALLFALLRRHAFPLLPLLALAVTLRRIEFHATFNVATEFRVDEILSGATLAYLLHTRIGNAVRSVLRHTPPVLPLLLLLVSSSASPRLAAFEYMRPYFAALLIGATICRPSGLWSRTLSRPLFAYLASVSYALYLWHPILQAGLVTAPSSPLHYLSAAPCGLILLAITAHLSTFHFEKHWIGLGNRIAARITRRPRPAPTGQRTGTPPRHPDRVNQLQP